jgi:hypothetical protein
MLIETPIKENDIVSLKMVGGDEIVCRITDLALSGHEYEVSKPLVVMMAQQGFGLAPFILTAHPDAKIKIRKDAVISMTKTYDGVAKQYQKQTSNLIV